MIIFLVTVTHTNVTIIKNNAFSSSFVAIRCGQCRFRLNASRNDENRHEELTPGRTRGIANIRKIIPLRFRPVHNVLNVSIACSNDDWISWLLREILSSPAATQRIMRRFYFAVRTVGNHMGLIETRHLAVDFVD